MKQEEYSNRRIAEVLNRVPQTTNNEVQRGTVTQLKRQKQNEKIYDYYTKIYDADAGQATYDKHRLNCGRRPKWADTAAFIECADDKMLIDKWYPGAVTGFALEHELFDRTIVPSSTTLYNWIDKGITRTKNLDLLEKLSSKPKVSSQKQGPNKRIIGHLIDKCPKEIDRRKSFGHWEIDTVVGNKEKTDAGLLTLVERQTRFEVIMKVNGKDHNSVNQAIRCFQERAGDDFFIIFKTITSDNGSKFADLHEALKDIPDVYFSHPYASIERGTSENQHKFIRRLFLKESRPVMFQNLSACVYNNG